MGSNDIVEVGLKMGLRDYSGKWIKGVRGTIAEYFWANESVVIVVDPYKK